VGIIATAIQYGVYLALLNIVDANIALTIGYIISLACNFLLSTYFTFSTKPTTKKAGGFVLSHVVNWLMQLGTINLFIYMGISKEWAPIPMYMVCMPINFLMVRFFLKDKSSY
jgi:putative flippase GtrA